MSCALLVSLYIAFAYYPLVVFRGSLASLGNWCSDHISHTSCAIVFPILGFDLYRKPVKDLLDQDSSLEATLFAGENDLSQGELFAYPNQPAGTLPLPINWSHFPRPYPPGCFLYAAPEAMWRLVDPVSFRSVNRFTVCKYLAAAFVAIWFLWRLLFVLSAGPYSFAISCVSLFIFAQELIYWSLSGIYDAVSVLFLLTALEQYHRRKWTPTIMWYMLGFLFHFRALWLAPLCVFAAWKAWPSFRENPALFLRMHAPTILITVIAGAATLLALGCIYPWLSKFPPSNEFMWRDLFSVPAKRSLVVAILCGVGVLVAIKEYAIAIIAAFAMGLVMATPQVQFWHSLFLVPICAFPVQNASNVSLVRLCLLGYFIALSVLLFHNPVLDMKLLQGLRILL